MRIAWNAVGEGEPVHDDAVDQLLPRPRRQRVLDEPAQCDVLGQRRRLGQQRERLLRERVRARAAGGRLPQSGSDFPASPRVF